MIKAIKYILLKLKHKANYVELDKNKNNEKNNCSHNYKISSQFNDRIIKNATHMMLFCIDCRQSISIHIPFNATRKVSKEEKKFYEDAVKQFKERKPAHSFCNVEEQA